MLHSVNYTFNESDVRWCYVAGRPEACVRWVLTTVVQLAVGTFSPIMPSQPYLC